VFSLFIVISDRQRTLSYRAIWPDATYWQLAKGKGGTSAASDGYPRQEMTKEQTAQPDIIIIINNNNNNSIVRIITSYVMISYFYFILRTYTGLSRSPSRILATLLET
jgi:hypothetical protein